MPVLSIFFGIVIRMWHDDHPPPHIHAAYQGFEALIDIRSGIILEGHLPKKAAKIFKSGVRSIKKSCPEIGNLLNAMNLWNVFQELIMMVKITDVRYIGDFKLALSFSDGSKGVFDGRTLLGRKGSLLEPLKDEGFFKRVYVEAGALSWPHGLELSPGSLWMKTRTVLPSSLAIHGEGVGG